MSELSLILAVLAAIAEEISSVSCSTCLLRSSISVCDSLISLEISSLSASIAAVFEEIFSKLSLILEKLLLRPAVLSDILAALALMWSEFVAILTVFYSTEVSSSSSLASICSLRSSFLSCKVLNALSTSFSMLVYSLAIIVTVSRSSL